MRYHIPLCNRLQRVTDNRLQRLHYVAIDFVNMDTAISTLKKNMTAVLNSVDYDFYNGPVEGIKRRIKSLKRSCFGFRNLDNFRKRIALIRS